MSRNRDVSLYNRYRYFVSDYDLKQSVKTFFLKTSCFCFFRAHSRFILGCSLLRNQGEGFKGATAPFAESLRKYNPKAKR